MEKHNNKHLTIDEVQSLINKIDAKNNKPINPDIYKPYPNLVEKVIHDDITYEDIINDIDENQKSSI